jgi:hypothetical protein
MEIFGLNKVARLLMTFACRSDCNLFYAFYKYVILRCWKLGIDVEGRTRWELIIEVQYIDITLPTTLSCT